MGDLDNPQRERLRRLSGDEPSAARTREPGRTTGVMAGHSSASAAVGKRTLTEDWGNELAGAAHAPNPATFSSSIARARRQLDSLRSANAAGDHSASCEAAHQARLAIDVAQRSAADDQLPEVSELETIAAPHLAAAFVPSQAAIDEAVTEDGSRTNWDRDVTDWRAARAREWQTHAAPIASQLGVEATIRIDDRAAAQGARGLAQAGVVHLSPTLAPGEPDALHVLAHELVHVAQSRLPVAGALVDAEHEADELAARLVKGSLPHRPRVGLAAGIVAADNGAKAAKATWRAVEQIKAIDAATIPVDQQFRVHPHELAFAAKREWLNTESGFADTGKAPQRVLEMLLALQTQGAITWATHSSLEKLAGEMVATSRESSIVQYAIHPDAFETIGIPPPTSAMVNVDGDGLVVIFRVNGIPAGHSVPLRHGDLATLLDAVEAFTGLTIVPAIRTTVENYSARTDRGENLARVSFNHTAMRKLVGHDVWDTWVSSQHDHHHDRSVPAPVLDQLTDDEKAHLAMWLTENLGLAATATPLTRFLLEVVGEIEHDKRYRDTILAYLRTHGLDGQIDPIRLRDAMQLARYAQDRVELRVAQPGHAFDDLPAIGSKSFDRALPAQLTQHSDLVLDGDSVSFEIAIDWSLTAMGSLQGLQSASARGGWSADIEWMFVRPELLGSAIHAQSHHDGDITFSQKLSLQPNESQAVWDVHAFVRTSHFLPTHVKTLVQVKTVAERMTNLRSDALGDPALARAMQPDDDGHMLGPSTFAASTPAQRAAMRARDRMNTELAAEYLEHQKRPENEEAIRLLRNDLNRRREEDAAIKETEAAGTKTFDVRAGYLSQTEPYSSGPMRVYGAIRPRSEDNPRMILVDLYDQSRIIDEQDYKFAGSGWTFEMALENAFTVLAAEYPKGKIDVFAESRDDRGEHTTGKTIGFERETYSNRKRVEKYLFHPIAQAALAGATVVALICAPEAGIPLLIGIAYGAATSVDDIATHAQNGTLSPGRIAMDMATMVLSVLPLAATARPIADSGAALFMLRVVDMEGQVIVMTLQAKEELERLQANEVASLGRMYAEMLELQKSTHASDPRLTQLREQMEAKASEARGLLVKACEESYEQGGLSLIHGLTTEAAIGRLGPHEWLETAMEHGPGHGNIDHQPEAPRDAERDAGHQMEPTPPVHDDQAARQQPRPEVESIPANASAAKRSYIFAGDDAELARAAATVKPLPGYQDVILHGTVDDFIVIIGDKPVSMDHRALAKWLSKQGAGHERIRLFSCETGKHPRGAAQHLANKYHTEVLAPTDLVHVFDDGTFVVGPTQERDTGHWETFKPQKAERRFSSPKEPSPERAIDRFRATRSKGGDEQKALTLGDETVEKAALGPQSNLDDALVRAGDYSDKAGRLATPGGAAGVEGVAKLAAISDVQIEAGLRILDPVFGANASAELKRVARVLNAELATMPTESVAAFDTVNEIRNTAQKQALDALRDPSLDIAARRAQLHNIVDNFESAVHATPHLDPGKFGFAEARRQIDALQSAYFRRHGDSRCHR